jgi:hypothetical protein
MIAQLRRSRTLYFRKHFTAATVLGLALVNTLEGVAKAAVFTVLTWGGADGSTGKRLGAFGR